MHDQLPWLALLRLYANLSVEQPETNVPERETQSKLE
jgi:hypothetical protein